MRIVLASDNAGKLKEFNSLLNPQQISLVAQKTLGVTPVAETGLTFVENALIKARHAARHTGLPALADDSGLEVAALQGAPGIYSARYAGEQATRAQHIEKLLTALEKIPVAARLARFYCVLVFLLHAEDPTPLICEGSWHGSILTAPRGEHGFGYDPVFFDPNEGMSAAELTAARKNQLSHRARAITALLARLPEKLAR